jgi:alkaline phosphatase D
MKSSSRCAALILLSACNPCLSAAETPLQNIAFGSCAKQFHPQPIWDSIIKADPDLFIFLGDNIYGDTTDMEKLRAKYQQLAEQPGYQRIKKHCPILATWDDHDYGRNDAGAEFSKKVESQQIFLDFFEEPADSPRRKHPGIYHARIFGPIGKRVQILLLDTRYFRSELNRVGKPAIRSEGRSGPYEPVKEPVGTILGETQWKWLEKQLLEPAEIRIIASSIQVISDLHGWECWGNHPHERERLYRLVKNTRAEGVIVLSGDRHHGEISRIDNHLPYPLYDITASGLNWKNSFSNEHNPHRIGVPYREEHFGNLIIDWEKPDIPITFQIRNLIGRTIIQSRTTLKQLSNTSKR